jgi:glyoxylase-like metal-dependent hydrolase (beta-lactamase superfamily II)
VEDRRAGWPWQRFWPTDDASAQPAIGSAASGELTPLAFSGWLAPGDRIDLGGRVLDVLHTPGHSRGSVSFLDREARALFTGDLLYLSQMYLFVPDADLAAFRASLQLIAGLAAEVDVIYPAHGPTPIRPADALAIQAAFETVWAGRPPDRHRALYGFDVAVHDFNRFSFLLPHDYRPSSVAP